MALTLLSALIPLGSLQEPAGSGAACSREKQLFVQLGHFCRRKFTVFENDRVLWDWKSIDCVIPCSRSELPLTSRWCCLLSSRCKCAQSWRLHRHFGFLCVTFSVFDISNCSLVWLDEWMLSQFLLWVRCETGYSTRKAGSWIYKVWLWRITCKDFLFSRETPQQHAHVVTCLRGLET